MKANKTHITYSRIPEKLHTRLTIVVEALPGSQSAHICQAITEYCDRVIPTLPTEQTADKQAAQA